MANPDGTVRSTALGARSRASPVPGIRLPVALEGSIGRRQEYRPMPDGWLRRISIGVLTRAFPPG